MTYFADVSPVILAASVTGLAALGAALFAFVAALINAWVARRNAKVQARVVQQVKLAEFRQAWINSLRECLVDMQSSINKPDIIEGAKFDLNLFVDKSVRMQLLLNPDEEPVKELLAAVSDLLDELAEGKEKDSGRRNERFRTAARAVLKYEWNVLKAELQEID